MAPLILTGVAKSFGDTLVLQNATFTLNSGDRVGLVGANGAGKSTLLRIIIGEYTPDAGSVRIDPADELGYLAQEMGDESRTVAELVAAARGALAHALAEMERLEAAMSAPHDDLEALLEAYSAATATYERLGGYSAWESDAILHGLGLGGIDQGRSAATLSGGEKARLAMALLLLRDPSLLLLDEPTNHLDFAALEWLEGYLATRSATMLIVSHDRQFLDRTVTRIIEIEEHTRVTTAYPGDYSYFAAEKARIRKQQEIDYQKQQEEIRALRHAIKVKGRQVAHNRPPKDNDGYVPYFKGQSVDAAVSRNVRSAEEKLARIESDPLPKPPRPIEINPDFKPGIFGSKQPLVAENIRHAWNGANVLDGIDLTVQSNARVVIVGENGAGKSTLLKILAGALKPDEGSVYRAPGVVLGYLDQEQEGLPETGTLYEVYASGLIGDFETLKKELLATGLFTWDELSRPVSALSAGQRRKLQLARLLAVRANLLLLDEPTNHISLDVLEEFEAALIDFAGPVVAISHDRRFIERFANEVWEVRDGRLIRHAGAWHEFATRHAIESVA